MSSADGTLTAPLRATLLNVALASIEYGLPHGVALPVRAEEHDPALRPVRATFVTLRMDGALRGCIGTLQATHPLVVDVSERAFAAAFRDPRFPAVTRAEVGRLAISISVLSLPEPLPVAGEADALTKIRPGVDGLILTEGIRRGTFLPSVWEQLPNPVDFLNHLKRKAGLPAGYWSDSITLARYTTESFGAKELRP